jgi:hypothetical protein
MRSVVSEIGLNSLGGRECLAWLDVGCTMTGWCLAGIGSEGVSEDSREVCM